MSQDELDAHSLSDLHESFHQAFPALQDHESTISEDHVQALSERRERDLDPGHAHIHRPGSPDPAVFGDYGQDGGQQSSDDVPAGNTPDDGVLRPGPGGKDASSWRAPLAVYDFYGTHKRHRPIKSEFTGHVRTVRVRLRMHDQSRIYIRKWRNIHQLDVYAVPDDQRYAKVSREGRGQALDRTIFSVQAVRDLYAELFPKQAYTAHRVKRVDLITAARLIGGKGRRFAPVSIFLAYADEDLSSPPLFFFLGGADILGKARTLYCSETMAPINAVGGFPYTNLACSTNFYAGILEMANNVDPKSVNLVIFRRGDSQRASHLNIFVELRRKDPRSLRRWVLSPLDRQVEAAKRVHTIGQGMNCTFKNPVAQEALGNAGRLLDWEHAPKQRGGEVKSGYSGCKKSDG